MNAFILVLAATLSLDTVIDSAEKAGADGVLLVRRGNVTVYERAWGAASCDGRERMTSAHLFDIGSITKVLTAAAARKALPLDLRVGDVFPEAPPDKANITVQQLLMHQSGLADSLGLDETYIKRAFFLRKLWREPLVKPAYSNAGYSLLAAMIEERTGMAYEEYLRKHIVEPAGVDIAYQRRSRLACGTLDGMPWGNTADYFGPNSVPGWYLLGNGALISSAAELDRWFAALWSGKLLGSEKTQLFLDAMLRKDRQGRRIVYTSGANNIFSSVYERWPDEDVVFVLLTSHSEWPKEKLLPELRPAIIEMISKP